MWKPAIMKHDCGSSTSCIALTGIFHLQVDLAPIQRKLPDEIMSMILGKLGAYNLGRTQCVCKAWHTLGFNEELWSPDCLHAFQHEPKDALVQLMRSQYRYVL